MPPNTIHSIVLKICKVCPVCLLSREGVPASTDSTGIRRSYRQEGVPKVKSFNTLVYANRALKTNGCQYKVWSYGLSDVAPSYRCEKTANGNSVAAVVVQTLLDIMETAVLMWCFCCCCKVEQQQQPWRCQLHLAARARNKLSRVRRLTQVCLAGKPTSSNEQVKSGIFRVMADQCRYRCQWNIWLTNQHLCSG